MLRWKVSVILWHWYNVFMREYYYKKVDNRSNQLETFFMDTIEEKISHCCYYSSKTNFPIYLNLGTTNDKYQHVFHCVWYDLSAP